MAQSSKKPIEVISWAPVASWKYKASYSDCPICKVKLEQTCTQCESNNTNKDSSCDPASGTCGHVFHKHCIDKWLVTSNICPICNTPYGTSVKNMNNDEDWRKLVTKNSKK